MLKQPFEGRFAATSGMRVMRRTKLIVIRATPSPRPEREHSGGEKQPAADHIFTNLPFLIDTFSTLASNFDLSAPMRTSQPLLQS